MKHRSTVTVSYSLSNLFENIFSLVLCQLLSLLYEMVQITSASVLHHHHDVLFVLENFVQTDDI
jgi:hypothetical protein